MLQELFNVLDLPGSSVRDVLAGENPFDQWTSPLSDDHRTSGAKLVNRWTGANENSWGGMIGGMGAEMLLDPMNLLPGFGVMKRALTAKRAMGLNRGIRAANEAQQALDAGRYGFVNAKRLAGGADEAAEAAGPLQQKFLGYDPGVTENYQIISHGTSNPFAGSDDFPAGKLDLRYMGTGAGDQAFGWGSYSAQDPKVSAAYKEYGGSNIDSNWVPTGPFHMQLNLPKEAEDRMIRGDVPLAGQPPLVQQALQEVQQEISPISIENVAGTDLIKKSLERVYRQGGLQDPIHVATNLDEREVPQKVAEYLQSKGIVGNKFLDRESRDRFVRAEPKMEWKGMPPGGSQDFQDIYSAIRDTAQAIPVKNNSYLINALRDEAEFKKAAMGDEKYADIYEQAANAIEAGQVSLKWPSLNDPGFTSNYVIWDQPTLDKTRIRKINGVNIPLANMLKGGRAQPTEAALDLVQSTQPMGSPLMQELPVPSLLSRREALALGIYNVAARGGFTVE